MNIFTKLAGGDYASTFRFGAPIGDVAAIDRRLTGLAQLTGGKGFRLYSGKPAKTINGKTRAERKAERAERANAATATYNASLKLAREKGLIGIGYVSPGRVAKLLADSETPAKVRKPRAKKVTAGVDTTSA